jgi:hypothetical protein
MTANATLDPATRRPVFRSGAFSHFTFPRFERVGAQALQTSLIKRPPAAGAPIGLA